MGCFWCKEKVVQPPSRSQSIISFDNEIPNLYKQKDVDQATVDRLVLETLSVIASLVNNHQEPPPSMMKLHNIADNENGFIQVVKSMVNVVPLNDPLGPSVIALLLDDCPLPSQESIHKVIDLLNLSKKSAIRGRSNPVKERNTCVVLGCIAETLAGPRNMHILSDDMLDYLFTNLEDETDPHVTLFTLLALEKLAQTSQNKCQIMLRFETYETWPIQTLEDWVLQNHYVRRQVGFCAQWLLDNLFIHKSRIFTYLRTDISHINVMLNNDDASEYLKMSADGLEARCDAFSFESVRCTAQANSGVWYYEVLIITPGVMQIGWATKLSHFLNHEGYGIGDDWHSIAYDGCRRLVWHNAKPESQVASAWKPGDILGSLLDIVHQQIIFYINGKKVAVSTKIFNVAQCGFCAAASFMSFQQCRFNFGADPFVYPPKDLAVPFKKFNEYNQLTPEQKIVLPRHMLINQVREEAINEDSCTLCYDKKASVRLHPCQHSGFCRECTVLLSECPLCRATIDYVEKDDNVDASES